MKKNMGLAATLNKMLDHVMTPYVARMDADDIAFPERLEKQYLYMITHPDIDLCGANIVYVGKNGDILYKNSRIPQDYLTVKKALKYKNCIAHPTYFAKTKAIKIIKYREDIRYAQDYDFLCRFIENGYRAANIPEYLLKYRIAPIPENKLVRQNITAYYVRKFYKKGQLSKNSNLGEIIERDILTHGEKKLMESAKLKENLKNAISNILKGKIKVSANYIRNVLFIHPYRMDEFISRYKYKIVVFLEKIEIGDSKKRKKEKVL